MFIDPTTEATNDRLLQIEIQNQQEPDFQKYR